MRRVGATCLVHEPDVPLEQQRHPSNQVSGVMPARWKAACFAKRLGSDGHGAHLRGDRAEKKLGEDVRPSLDSRVEHPALSGGLHPAGAGTDDIAEGDNDSDWPRPIAHNGVTPAEKVRR